MGSAWQAKLGASLPWISGRIRIRALEQADVAQLADWRRDPRIMQWLGGCYDNSPAELWDLIEKTQETRYYIVELIESREAIGFVGFVEDPKLGSAEVDPFIGLTAEFQRSGFGSECLDLLCDAWLTTLGRPAISTTVNPENVAALRLLAKKGFQEDTAAGFRDKFGTIKPVYRLSAARYSSERDRGRS